MRRSVPQKKHYVPTLGDRKTTTKKLCDKDFAERSGELSGAIRLKTLVLLGDDRYPPRIVQKILWCCSCDFLVLCCDPSIPPKKFLGPSGPKLETELKMSSRGLPAPGSKKLKTESKKSRKS